MEVRSEPYRGARQGSWVLHGYDHSKEDEMSANVTLKHVASDGTRAVFRQGAGNEGPRPIDDEKLEAVAGGADFRVTFTDGCVVDVTGVANFAVASETAVDYHSKTGHANHDHTITGI